jgi:hypothetical protein
MIFWECRQKAFSESRPGFDLDGRSSYRQPKYERDPITWWKEAVESFSQAQLSKEADKLVAIAGVAISIYEKPADVYCAGLWRKNIERQLLWKVVTDGRRPLCYRAPSWYVFGAHLFQSVEIAHILSAF